MVYTSRVLSNLLFSATLKFFSARTHKATTHAIPYNIITTFISEVHFNKYCLPTLDFLPRISKLKGFMCLLCSPSMQYTQTVPHPLLPNPKTSLWRIRIESNISSIHNSFPLFSFSPCFLTMLFNWTGHEEYRECWMYEGWNFNSGNYLFTTDTK